MCLRDGDGGEAECVMLFMKYTENQCVTDCGKCKNSVRKTITFHFVKSAAKF